jgi:hypothetical protein
VVEVEVEVVEVEKEEEERMGWSSLWFFLLFRLIALVVE